MCGLKKLIWSSAVHMSILLAGSCFPRLSGGGVTSSSEISHHFDNKAVAGVSECGQKNTGIWHTTSSLVSDCNT